MNWAGAGTVGNGDRAMSLHELQSLNGAVLGKPGDWGVQAVLTQSGCRNECNKGTTQDAVRCADH